MSLASINPAEPRVIEELRAIGPDEEQALLEAIRYCRNYAQRLSAELVIGSHSNLKEAADRIAQPMPDHVIPAAVQNITVALVAFCLVWRLFLDHTRRDLSQRFGDPSDELRRFTEATHDAYDRHPGYRLVEGLRNFVQHVGLPELNVRTNRRVGCAGEPPVVHTSSVTLDRASLVAWKKCPSMLRADLEHGVEPLPILDLVDDAMEGFAQLVATVTAVDGTELRRSLALLQGLLDEVAPSVPVIADFSGVGQAGGSLRMVRFDDLARFLDLTRNQAEDGEGPTGSH